MTDRAQDVADFLAKSDGTTHDLIASLIIIAIVLTLEVEKLRAIVEDTK